MEERIFLRVREIMIEFPDGATQVFGHLQPIRKGWVVRVKNQCDFEGEAGMMTAITIARETTQTIGGWTDGEGIEMWDVVMIFKNEEEATKAGIENEQMAIYQIETSRLKWLS